MLWITGAAGFIGSCFARQMAKTNTPICLVDKLSYASNMASIQPILGPNVFFHQLDIGAGKPIAALLRETQCSGLVNFAAESHVDRSISAPVSFAANNVLATVSLLNEVNQYWQAIPEPRKSQFRFLHISTDEVFGALGESGQFNEFSNYAPNSPYSASKAAADHFVRSYSRTFGLPTLTIHSSNNFGPWQHSEKFIPTVIRCALTGLPIPIYGSGKQVRDWIYVEDNCQAIQSVLHRGTVGQNYCVGGNNELSNLQLARLILRVIEADVSQPRMSLDKLIQHVDDRPGHDFRYSVDSSKVTPLLALNQRQPFEKTLKSTIRWYLRHCQA